MFSYNYIILFKTCKMQHYWLCPTKLYDGIGSRPRRPSTEDFLSSCPHCALLLCPSLTVYMEGFVIAASNLPGNIFTILMMDSTGGKALLCELDELLTSVNVCFLTSIKPRCQ